MAALPVKPTQTTPATTVDCDRVEIKSTGVSPVGLKRVAPYWHQYSTMAKGRWFNREILEIVSTEFRDRSIDYYRFALEAGVTTVNGKIAKPGTIIRNGDRIQNMVHRHEPPVTSTPIEILVRTPEYIIINKPGSIPVHATGRYYKNTLVHALRQEFGSQTIHTINRLDRLTSGLMIIPLVADLARKLGNEFVEGKVRKEYVARCKGNFPRDEVICEQPMLTVDRQMGLNVIHPDGKPAQTIFNRIFYDPKTDTSVIRCRPLTGRSHQIRVHLQYLGHPIANDPIYNNEAAWVRRPGPKVGCGGVDVTPSHERAPPVAPDILQQKTQADAASDPSLTIPSSEERSDADVNAVVENSLVNLDSSPAPSSAPNLLPRESGHDIGMGSPVPLSSELVGVITRLRNMKDKDEDWSRWRDVIFRAQGAKLDRLAALGNNSQTTNGEGNVEYAEEPCHNDDESLEREAEMIATGLRPLPSRQQPTADPKTWVAKTESGTLYCTECYLPLHSDPEPERLYIFLHALRYTTSLGSFETKMPEWAEEDWIWGSGRRGM